MTTTSQYYEGHVQYEFVGKKLPEMAAEMGKYLDNQGPIPITFYLSASNLRAADSNGKSDPYAVYEDRAAPSITRHKTPVESCTLNPVWYGQRTLYFNRSQPDSIVEFHVFDKDKLSKDEFLGCAKLDWQKYLSPIAEIPPQKICLPLGPAADTKAKTAEKIKGEINIYNITVPHSLWTCAAEIEALKNASGCAQTELVLSLAMQYKEVFGKVEPQLALWTIIAQTDLFFRSLIDCGKQFNVIHFDEKEQQKIFCDHDVQLTMKKYYYAMFDSDNDGRVSLQDFVITAVRIYNKAEAALATAFFRAFDEDKDGIWTRAEVEKLTKTVLAFQAGIAKQLYFMAATEDAKHLDAGPGAFKLLNVVVEAYYSVQTLKSRANAIMTVMARGNPEVITHDDFVFWYTDPTGRARLLDALALLPGNQEQINKEINTALELMHK